MLAFNTHFWGERNNGFDILYHNMKGGFISSRELEDYVRESCNVEDAYVKFQLKLAKMAANYGNRGSFGPFWQVFKTLAEKLASVHQQLSTAWQDVIKEIHKYSLEQQKKHREMKEQETATGFTVQNIQSTIVALQKAKETYHARCYDCEKLKRESASLKDIERAETKVKKSLEDYKTLLEKYSNARKDFDVGMNSACIRFQEVEEKHLQQMKHFVDCYARACESQYNLLGQVYDELRISCGNLSVSKLINTLIQSKGTGTEKPGPIEFVEPDLSTLSVLNTSTEGEKVQTNSSAEKPRNQITGILSIPTKYRKKRNTKKDNCDVAIKDQHLVDADGFSIPPENPLQNHVDHESPSSSSDSEEDSSDKVNKIKLEIKPKSSPVKSDNLNDIRGLVKNFKLSSDVSHRRTPIQEIYKTQNSNGLTSPNPPSADLINLDFNSPGLDTSNSSEQLKQHSADSCGLTSPDMCSLSQSSIQTPTPPQLPSRSFIDPLPPPITNRTSATSLPYIGSSRPGRQTPDMFRLERGESMLSLGGISGGVGASSAFSTSVSFGTSRGPSPLTLGMHDTIPIAIAFSETVNAIFKPGQIPIQRITGEMIVSFPSGIIRILLENPNPAQLSFSIKNISNIEQIKVNKPLVIELDTDNVVGHKYAFEMSALVEHLRRQTEQNRSAAYFNIDILKYQLKSDVVCLPFDLSASCSLQPLETVFKLEYEVGKGSGTSSPSVPTTFQALVSLEGNVAEMCASPVGVWLADKKRAIWKLPNQSEFSKNAIEVTFKLVEGPSLPPMAALQFIFEGGTLSGLDFELLEPGYRVSLIKKRFVSGKYTCDAKVLDG